MEWNVGEIKQVNGEYYQCIKELGCDNCDFLGTKYCSYFECSPFYRVDKTSIIFKKLEKVGEPFKRNGYMYQEYKVHTYPLLMSEGAKIPTDNGFAVIIKQNKEDMEEKKLNLKPFNIQKAKEGKPVCTRDGRKARIICFDRVTNSTNEYTGHLIVLVTNPNGDEQSFYYTEKGNLAGKDEYDNHKWDLMMLPEKKEGWINVYKGGLLSTKYYSSKEKAVSKASQTDYIDTVKIEWEE